MSDTGSVLKMRCKKILSIIGDIIISPFNPIKRHRLLYGYKWGWLIYSLGITVIVVFCIYQFSKKNGLRAEELIKPVNTCTSIYGNEIKNPEEGKNMLLWAVISQFADPGNIPQSVGRGTRFAFICAIGGVFCLSGLLISSLVSFISRRQYEWQKGLIYYNRPLGKYFCFNDFVVIIGVNEQTATIVKSSLHRGIKYVLIQSNRDIEKVRMWVNLSLDEEDEKRVVFYHGERTSEEDLSRLRLEDANEVYILGEDMRKINEQDHDTYNITCLEYIAKYIHNNPRRKTKWWGWKMNKEERLKCHVNFEYQSTFMAFKFTHLYRSMNSKVEFIPFNVHEIWAKKVLVDNSAIIPMGKYDKEMTQQYLPLDTYWEKNLDTDKRELRYIKENSQKSVHLVVMGMNQMGVALAMQTALLVHLPNFHKYKNRNLRTTITFIDENAVREGEYLRSRYDALFSLCQYRIIVNNKDVYNFEKKNYSTSWIDPMVKGRYAHLGENFMDIQWEFIEGNVASPGIRGYMSAIAEDVENKTSTFAVCFNNPQQSIATALYLPEVLLKRALQILVYQQNSFDMVKKVATTEKEWKRYEKLRPFGMIEGCYSGVTFDNLIAKLVNLIYKKNLLTLETQGTKMESYINQANYLWKELGIVDKYANIDLVDSFEMKLRSLGDSEQEQRLALLDKQKVRMLSMAEHLRWVTERLTMGFRPLDQEELALQQTEGQNGSKYSKEYYKSKSRAHLDICSYEDLEKGRDKVAMDKNMDERIIKMIFSLKEIASEGMEIVRGSNLKSL